MVKKRFYMDTENLPNKPKLRQYISIVPMGENELQMRVHEKVVVFSGKTVTDLFPEVFPLLDGVHTVSEIISALQERVEESVVIELLTVLNKRFLLEDSDKKTSCLTKNELKRQESQMLLFSRLSGIQHSRQEDLKNARVGIIGCGNVGSNTVTSLALAGVGNIVVTDFGKVTDKNVFLNSLFRETAIGKNKAEVISSLCQQINPTVNIHQYITKIKSASDFKKLLSNEQLIVVCLDRPAIALYEWINEVCVTNQLPWISGSLDGEYGSIGPFVVPHQTACYQCYQLRLQSNLAVDREYLFYKEYLRKNPNQTDLGSTNSFAASIGNLLALEVIKIISGFTFPSTLGYEFTIDFCSLETKLHPVLKLPRCPVCSKTRTTPTKEDWNIKYEGNENA